VLRHLIHGLRVLLRPGAADRDLDDELRHFVEEAAAAHAARGVAPAEARRRAIAEVGSPVRAREAVRDGGWERWVSSGLADLRLAVRLLTRTPIFTAIVIAVVALGSGAVTTVFSAMNAILLRPIPGVEAQGSLVAVSPSRRDGSIGEQISYPRYAHLRDQGRSLDGVAAWGRVAMTIAGDGAASTVLGNLVSANYFDVLGVQPAAGRFFAASEAQPPGAPVVVVSEAYWRDALGGDPRAIGRTMSVNGHPFTLIGVAPLAFRGVYTGLVVDAWAPLSAQPQLRPRSSLAGGTWLWSFGRLRAGVDREAAAGELSALTQAHRQALGEPSEPDAFDRMQVAPLTGLPGGTRGALAFMSVLLGAAALVLIIAGINVAAMLSARYAARARDLAVRTAMGAGRLRLIRHLLTEVALLFVLGALGGFAVASAATAGLERLPLPGSISVTLELSPDLRVLGVAVAVSLVAGLIFGLGPALQGARRDITDRLKAESAGGGTRRSRLGRVLITGQVALSLVLLVAAGLFARAVDRGARVDPGFDMDGVATAVFEPESWGYDDTRTTAFYQALRDRLAAEPGVRAVGYANRVPLMFGSSVDAIEINDARRDAHYVAVDAGYFDALRLPIRRGRAVVDGDRQGAPRVAVVNETLARLLEPAGDAVGRTFRFRDAAVTVVGIARDARYASLDETTPPLFYVPLAQERQPRRALFVKTAAPAGVATAIAAAVRAIDPRLPPTRVAALRDETRLALFPQRAAAIVTGGLGATGLLLAMLGLYGTVSADATARRREIGVRLALGADRGAILRGVVSRGLWIAGPGVAVGLLLAAAAMPLLEPWLFGVDPRDGLTYAAIGALLVMQTLVASYVPARRAAALDPVRVLRAE
jgi:putative ABC transport system permease protein